MDPTATFYLAAFFGAIIVIALLDLAVGYFLDGPKRDARRRNGR